MGASKVRTDGETLDARRHDYWVLSHLREWRGDEMPRPRAVVRPTCTDDVVALMKFANEHGAPLMPYGLGSGVVGGVLAAPETILVDMSEMNRVREIDETNLLATFDAGLNGLEAEEYVAAKGLTIGHWPQSIAVSSVGGWVATRAAGQYSTAYGNIEDMVYGLEVVLPNGKVVNLGKAPRAAAGPDLRHLFIGAEGTMGIVTGVTFSLRRAPEAKAHTAFHAKSMAQGLEAQRLIMQADWRPPVMRQYDAMEASRHFGSAAKDDHAMLLMIHEGPALRVEAEVRAVTEITASAGLEPAPSEAVDEWMKTRNRVPTWSQIFGAGVIVDTVEVSARWSEIGKIYRDVVASLGDVGSYVTATAHSSHAYRSGLNLYFTFAAVHSDAKDMERSYLECWKRVMDVTAAGGGGIAHHHGIGRLRKPYLANDLGETGVELLRTIKTAVDPVGIMNPGNLIPER